MQKIILLLQVFKDRAADPALVGHTSYTQEAFKLAAKELAVAIHETIDPNEPADVVAWIPPDVRDLVHEALHFNPLNDDDWETLGNAALNIQSGPS